MSKLQHGSLHATWAVVVGLLATAILWLALWRGIAAEEAKTSTRPPEPVAQKPADPSPTAAPVVNEPPPAVVPTANKTEKNPALGRGRMAPEVHKIASLKLPNGLETSVYPADPLHPYHEYNWHTTVPFAVAGVRWDKEARKLQVDLDFTVPMSAENRLKHHLLAIYKEHGQPQLSIDALSVMRMEPIAFTLALDVQGQEVVLYETGKVANLFPTKQSVFFHVPAAAEYATLYETLNTAPHAVNVVFNPKYSYHGLMGGTIETQVSNSAWEALREEMRGPRGEKPATDFLVWREGVAKVKKRLRQHILSKTSLFVEESQRDFVIARLDREIEKNLARLSEPLTPLKLCELAEGALVWTPRFPGLAEVTPNSFDDLIRRARELKEEEEQIVQKAKTLSDVAKDDKVHIRDFHKTASTMALSASANVRIAIFSGGAKMSLNRSWDELKDTERNEIHSARNLMKNESEYLRHVKSRHESEVEGELRRHKSYAKTLEIDRVSNTGIAQINSAGGSIAWLNGMVTIAKPVSLPLAVVKEQPDDKERDVVIGLREDHRKLIGKFEALAKEHAAIKAKVEAQPWLDKLAGSPNIVAAGKLHNDGTLLAGFNMKSTRAAMGSYTIEMPKPPTGHYLVIANGDNGVVQVNTPIHHLNDTPSFNLQGLNKDHKAADMRMTVIVVTIP